jgi:ribosomal-protein-alanine N-acetyltransferase
VIELETARLRLVAYTAAMARAEVGELERLIDAAVPGEWLEGDIHAVLPLYAARAAADPAELGFGPWLVVERASRTVVGDAGFLGKPGADGTIELGYRIISAYTRRGYGFEAARALVDWALSQPGVDRIVAGCAPDNAPSIRILEKLGMRRVGSKRGELRWELR